jgi:hypothetical protein
MVRNPADVEALFFAARQREPRDRAAYLDAACGADAALRRRVEQLLSAQAELGSFLECPALAARGAEPRLDEGPGTRIGPYQLVEQLGEGGFGVVFLAEQQHPVRRQVALKVVKPGMETRQPGQSKTFPVIFSGEGSQRGERGALAVSGSADKRKEPLSPDDSGCLGVGATGLKPVTPSVSIAPLTRSCGRR